MPPGVSWPAQVLNWAHRHFKHGPDQRWLADSLQGSRCKRKNKEPADIPEGFLLSRWARHWGFRIAGDPESIHMSAWSAFR